jgi:hypothetical protein
VATPKNSNYDPTVWKPFLDNNRMKQCDAKTSEPPMPLSFYAPQSYFDGIPLDERIPPIRAYNQSQVVPSCNGQMVDPTKLNAYEFQTERFLTTIGLNIYDGAIHSMAISLLGEPDLAISYEDNIINQAITCQFADLRGDAPCKGVIATGECIDKDQAGVCGFCYGDGSNDDRTLPKANAWSFRMISDYWALENTVDARCPELGHLWTWNDYRPILGENAWTFLTGPLQVAYIKYGSATAIPDNDISITMALNFLSSLPRMQTSTGAVSYSPYNTLTFGNYDTGYDVSTENNVSLLGGLKMLRYILTQKNIFPDQVGIIDKLSSGIESFIKSSFDPNIGYFRQGGSFASGSFIWNTGSSGFAVDCQTWTMSVIGPVKVDQWFGQGTADKIWAITKKLGGYNYLAFDGSVEGLGYSINNVDEAFSGEWTFGGINMLRIFGNVLSNSTYTTEADSLRDQVASQLTESDTINGVSVQGVRYANKRYWIPFGWWANPLLSAASTGWATLVDSKYNPFYLGGKYLTDY